LGLEAADGVVAGVAAEGEGHWAIG
jgi:hypothetical protein